MAIDFELLHDNIDLKEVLTRFKDNLLKSFNCVKIGKIINFYSKTQTADIQIEEYPKISQVPVSFIYGGDFSIQVPIKFGDDCIVLFCDTDLDNYVEGKGTIPAFSADRHGLNGAIALVGITNIKTKIEDYITNGIRIKYKDNYIEIKDSEININGADVVVEQGVLTVKDTATGSFMSYDGKLITVVNGIITSII